MEEYTTLYQNVRVHNSKIDSFSYIANNTVIIGANIGIHPTKDFVSAHPIFYSTESHVGVNIGNDRSKCFNKRWYHNWEWFYSN